MPQQLVYTSIARGLDLGRSGYCTAARTADMRKPLVAALEGFSRFDFAKGLSKTILSFRVVELGTDRFFVCSRTADCGFDYTGRTNFISHHVVFSEAEVSRFGSSADFAANWTGWKTSWNEPARVLTDADFAPFTPRTYTDDKWRTVCGQRAMPLEYAKHLLFRDTDERAFLELLAESMAHEKSASWSYTWTTRLQNGESAREFNFVLADAQTPETVAEFKNFDPAKFVYATPENEMPHSKHRRVADADLSSARGASATDFDFDKLPKASRVGGLVLPISAFAAVLVVCGYLLFSQFSDAPTVEVDDSSTPQSVAVLTPPANDSENEEAQADAPAKSAMPEPKPAEEKPSAAESPKPAAPVAEKEMPKQIAVSAEAQKLKRILGFGGAEYADIQCVVVFVKGKDTANSDGNVYDNRAGKKEESCVCVGESLVLSPSPEKSGGTGDDNGKNNNEKIDVDKPKLYKNFVPISENVLGKLNNEINLGDSPVKSGVLYKYPAEISGVNYGILFIEDETKWASAEVKISEICNVKDGKFGVDYSLFDIPHFYTSDKIELVFDWNINSPTWLSGDDLKTRNVEKKRKEISDAITKVAELSGKIAAKEKEIAQLQPAEKSTAKLPENAEAFVGYLRRGNPELAKFAEHKNAKQFIKECYGEDPIAAEKLKGVPAGLNKKRITEVLRDKSKIEYDDLKKLTDADISTRFKAKNSSALTELKTKIKGLFDAMNNIKSPDCSRYKDFKEQLDKIKDIAKFQFSNSTAFDEFRETKKVISELNKAFTKNENTLWKSIKNNKNDKKRDKLNAAKDKVNDSIGDIDSSINKDEALFMLIEHKNVVKIVDKLLDVAEGPSRAQARLKEAQAEMEKLKDEKGAKLDALAKLLNRGGAAEELSADKLQKIKAEVQNFKNSDVRGTVKIKFKRIKE